MILAGKTGITGSKTCLNGTSPSQILQGLAWDHSRSCALREYTSRYRIMQSHTTAQFEL